jgi:hypothetical protein
MRVAPFFPSEFNIVAKGIHLLAQIGVLFQIPGRIKQRMRIAAFPATEVEVMQDGIEFEGSDIAVLRQIPLRVEERVRAEAMAAAPPQIMLKRV